MVKLFSIVVKNVKIVSRSWMYVALLVLLPTILVLGASAMLDSVKVKNVRIGIVESPEAYRVREIMPQGNFRTYKNFDKCFSDLEAHNIPVCIYPRRELKETVIDIYFDNSKLLVSQYAKQYISKNVLEEQLVIFELTLEEVFSQMNLLAQDVEFARDELEAAYEELVAQEGRIIAYQQNFSDIEDEFNVVYEDVKYYQPLIEENINALKEVKQFLGDNLTEFNRRNEELRLQIELLKPLLEASLPPDQYAEIEQRLDSMLGSLDIIERDLEELDNRLYYQDPDLMLQDFNDAVATLDETKILLEQINVEIASSMELIERNKQKAQDILDKIEDNKEAIEELRANLRSTSDFKIVLNDAYEIRESTSYLFFPFLFVLIIAFTSIILSNMFVVEQTHRPGYRREMTTPTSDTTFLLGDFIVSLSIVLLQVGILFVIGEFVFNLSIFSNFLYLAMVSVIMSSIFVFIGMSIGYIVRSRHISTLISTFTLLFFIIFSDLLIPRQLASPFIRNLTSVNPFVMSNTLLFDTMIFSKVAEYASLYVTVMIFFLMFAFFFTYVSKKIGKYRILRE